MNAARELVLDAAAPAEALAGGEPRADLGWIEIALPLWHRRRRLLLTAVLAFVAFGALAMLQPVRFTARASFVVQPVLRPSQAALANTLPAIAGLVGNGSSAIDQQVAILKSLRVADAVVQHFGLAQAWKLPPVDARQKLIRRTDIVVGRRESVVQVLVEDEVAPRAAAIANRMVDELRRTLQGFALDEARQRRTFYEIQLAGAREAVEAARGRLQAAGFDKAALQSDPVHAGVGYERVQAEISAAEVRLAALRRARAEGSPEVQQQLAQLGALRAQLAREEAPRGAAGGAYVTRMREFRQAEAVLESLARQAEAARVDEASDPLPFQVLDAAVAPVRPSSPRPGLWVLLGTAGSLLLHGGWIVARHRMAMTRNDPAYLERLAQLRAALPGRGGRA